MSDYPCIFCDGNHDSNRGHVHCIRILTDRMKELESKLGAVDVGLSTDRKAVEKRPIIAGSPPAASSVSAEEWRSKHSEQARRRGWQHFARACDLAAAVTACFDSGNGSNLPPPFSVAELLNIALAFVRGEPLPQKGG